MLSDPLNPISLFEVGSVLFGVLIFILVPGLVFSRWLKVNCRNFQESILFAVILGYLSLHVLAYVVFIGKSNLPWYIFAAGSLIYGLLILVEILRSQRDSGYRHELFYYLIYSLLVVVILVYYYDYQQQGRFIWDAQEKLFAFASDWDDLHHVSMVNESKRWFLPEDNPFLPGTLPFYHSWLGNLLPSFLVKCLGIDLIHAYYLWTPCFFYIAFMLFIHHLVRRFSGDQWTPLISIGLFFLTPELGLGQMSVRSMAGIFLIFSTVIFMTTYFSTWRKTDLALSFNWIFLYSVKGNFLLALLPGLTVFYLYALFRQRRWNADIFKVYIVCSVFQLFLFWVSRSYFGIFYLPDPQPFIFNLSRIYGRIISILWHLLPLLAIFFFYYLRKLKKGEIISPFEKTLWFGVSGFLLFSSLAGKHMEGGLKSLIYLGLSVAFPIIVGKLLVKPILFRGLGGACIILFATSSFSQPATPENPVRMTEDELAMIRFIRRETLETSVILYNVPRYNDRPAIMSSLTYRKSFIDEGERFANSYSLILERRLYDYWNFLLCDCSHADREHFFAKYPQIHYLVEYDTSFSKMITAIVGMPDTAYALPVRNKKANLFHEVFHQGSIAVYKINR